MAAARFFRRRLSRRRIVVGSWAWWRAAEARCLAEG